MHILVSTPPHMAPSEIMRRGSGAQLSKLFEEFPLAEETLLMDGISGHVATFVPRWGR